MRQDSSEALADFQLYAGQARDTFSTWNVDFEVVYARSFQIRLGGETRTFTAGRAGVGYYFVAPGKKARVVYGVASGDDLLQIGKEYFGL